MRQIVKSMLTDGVDGSISSKRVVTLSAFIVCVIGFLADQFFGYKVSQIAYDSMMYIVVAGLGFTGLEKFSPKK